MQVILTLRAVSGYWTPAIQTAYANTDLHIKIKDNGQIKGKAVLFFNGAAFVIKNNECVIPANKLKETNHCILQDQNEVGNVLQEWRLIETLCFDLAKLDKMGEKQMLAEREFFREIKEQFNELKKVYKEEMSIKQNLIAEIISQGKVIQELQKDVEAIKNEPVI
jgi:hypothetical protein